LPRWYAWIAAVLVIRAIGENVSIPLALATGGVALVAYWGYRVGTSAYDVPAHRGHAARREVRRIALEVGDALLGWAIIVLAIVGIVAIVATWPPNWGLVLVVCVLAVAALVALGVSIYGAGSIVRRYRDREWRAINDELEALFDAWGSHMLSVEPTDRTAVERVVASVYAGTRRSGEPNVQWASSPPEFARMLADAAGARRLHRPPPWWTTFSWYWTPWWPVWDDDDTVRTEVGAALAAGVEIEAMQELVANTSWFSFRKDIATALEHPAEIHTNRSGQLHNAAGPAVRFADGWSAYLLEGVVVPAEAIEDPQGFDAHAALQHDNLEVRRVLLQHLGWDRLIRGSGLTPVADDHHGRLWHLPVPGSEPVLLLEVENATPEPDGTHRRYFVRVPPYMSTPRGATAWTFGLSEREYAPDLES
jgi:hypothetical protein